MWLLLGCSTPPCLGFVGDVSLSRGVAEEIDRRGSPWVAFPDARWVGNLEGTLARGACGNRICLGIQDSTLEALRGGPFLALSVANNHSFDHGPDAHAETSTALRAMGITPLPGNTVTELTYAGRDWAFVAMDLTGGDSLEDARLALTRARAHTPWVVALPHWGAEGLSELGPGQEATARILRDWGATLIVGSGAHVPQAVDCQDGAATYYGLGNHLFDQIPEATHTGLQVDCCPTRAGLDCTSRTTTRTARSTFPSPGTTGETCHIPTPPAVDRAWEAHPWRDHFRSVQPLREVNGWFTLHDHWSDIDGEDGLRPYVFRMNADGSFTDLWRGSSLARPLLAARLFDWRGGQLLCAIHRGDTFLAPDPTTSARVRRVYRWSGFGFRAVEDPEAQALCETF